MCVCVCVCVNPPRRSDANKTYQADSKQIAYCPSNTTTILYFGIATCFGRFRPSSGYEYNIAK